MQETWKIFGHGAIKTILSKQLASGLFPHAYLFSGPEGIGKKTLALEFAAKILGTDRLASHPDFIMLDQTEEIAVEQLRDFISRLSLKPLSAVKKVAIINNADRMNVQSGNALLKTLEEPSASTIIILIGNGRQLLPTVVSRCQTMNMQLFSMGQLEEFAAAKNLKADADILELCFGSPGELISLSEDRGMLQEKQNSIAEWKKLKSRGPAERFLDIGRFADLETESLDKLLKLWLFAEESGLQKKPEGFAALSALGQALLALSGNQNKKSVLQSLFLKI